MRSKSFGVLPAARRTGRASFLAVALTVLLAASCGDGPSGTGNLDGTCGHIEYAGGVNLNSAGSMLFHQYGFVSSGELTIPVGGALRGVQVKFLDADGNPIDIPNDCDIMRVETDFLDPTIAEMQREPGLLWTIDFAGKKVGTTTVRVELWHQVHRHFFSEAIPVTVTPVP